MIDVVPEDADNWLNGFVGWGFYDLYNTEIGEDGNMSARRINAITENFSDSGIYAGVITREVYIANGGAYIDVNLYGRFHDINGDGIKDANESWVTDASIKLNSNIYSITSDALPTSGNFYNEAEPLQYSETSWSEVQKGDRVMWVGSAKGTAVSDAAFIVDLSHGEDPSSRYDNDIYWNTAEFLGYHGTPNAANNWNPDPIGSGLNIGASATPRGALWRLIWNEQAASTTAVWNITYEVVDEDGNDVTLDPTDSITPVDRLKSQSKDRVEVEADIDGYDVTSMTVTTLNDKGDGKAADCYMEGDGKWYLNNITKDITVEIVVTPTVDKYTVTLKDNAAGPDDPAIDTVTIPVSTVKDIDLTKAPYARAGYEITGVTIDAAIVAAVTTTPGTVNGSNPGEKITVTNLTANGNITLTYTPVSTQVTVTTAGVAPTISYAAIPAEDTNNNTAVSAGTVTSTTPFATTLKYGKTVTLSWTGAAHTTYAISADTNCTYEWVSQVEGGNHTLKVTANGAAALTITGTTAPALKFLAGTGVGTKAAGVVAITMPTTVYTGDTVSIDDTDVDVNTGDTLLGLTWTQYGENGGSGSFVRNAADDGWEIPAGVLSGTGDVIISAKVVTDASNTVTVTNNTGLNLLGAAYDADGDADGAAATVTATPVVIQPDGSYVIQAAPGTKLVCQVTAGNANATITGDGTDTITIANVVGAVAITLTVTAN